MRSTEWQVQAENNRYTFVNTLLGRVAVVQKESSTNYPDIQGDGEFWVVRWLASKKIICQLNGTIVDVLEKSLRQVARCLIQAAHDAI